MFSAPVIVTALVVIIAAIALRIKSKFNYWRSKGVPQLRVRFPFGNAPNPFRIRKPFFLKVKEYYDTFKGQGHDHGGIYMMTRPVYMPIHPDYVKNVMTTDFANFYDRGTYYNERADPLSAHLFNLEGKQWRSLRAKLTPTFTTGKLRMMFPTMLQCGEQMLEAIGKMSDRPVDIKDVLSCYSTDVIGSVAFGLECNSFKDPDAEFRRYGREIFRPTFKRKVRVFLITTFPSVCRWLGLVFIPRVVRDFFLKVVWEMVEHRTTNDVRRNDFMQILIDLKTAESLTIEQIAAQAFVFFIAGFETSATTMNFCLFELAQNREIQETVRREIGEVLSRHGGALTYDAIDELKYLEQVLNETLRKYPAVPHLSRKCTVDYTVPGTGVRLERGKKVFISVLGLHRDAEFYPEPERFDPARFGKGNVESRHPFAFIPFGEGPRNCIGSRFGIMQTKVGLVLLLNKFTVKLSDRTELPLMLEPSALLMTTKNTIWLEFEKASATAN